MYLSTALATSLLVGASVAKVVEINVGKSGLTFSPSSSTADVGDTLEFHFFGTFHTAVQGDFDHPCSRGSLSGSGFASGPIKNGADGSGSVLQVQVKDKNPIYFYCGTPSHCQSGMVGAVNAPSSGNTLDAYKSAAANTDSSELPPSVQGGVVVPVGTAPQGGAGSSSSEASQPSSTSVASAETSAQGGAESTLSGVSEPTTFAPSAGSAAPTSAPTSASASTKTSAPASNATAQPTQSFVPASGGSSLIALAGNTVFMAGLVAGFGFLFAFA